MKRTLALCFAILGLSACSTVSDLPKGYRLGAQNDEGLAIVSLTLSGKNLDRVSTFEYRVREAVADESEEVKRSRYFYSARQHARWLHDRDAQGATAGRTTLIVKSQALAEPLDVIESGKTVGRVAALRLPAGEYELYDWKVVVPDQYGGAELGPKRTTIYRFKIEAGRGTYLGNVDLHLTEQDTYNIAVENKATRDFALLARKLPSMRAEDIIYQSGKMRSREAK